MLSLCPTAEMRVLALACIYYRNFTIFIPALRLAARLKNINCLHTLPCFDILMRFSFFTFAFVKINLYLRVQRYMRAYLYLSIISMYVLLYVRTTSVVLVCVSSESVCKNAVTVCAWCAFCACLCAITYMPQCWHRLHHCRPTKRHTDEDGWQSHCSFTFGNPNARRILREFSLVNALSFVFILAVFGNIR